MPRPLSRALLGVASVGAGALAVVGAIAVRGPGLIGVGLAAILAACAAVGIAREAPAARRASTLEVAVRAAGGAVGVLLVVAGISTVAGGVVATLAVLAAAAVVVVRMARRTGRPAGAAATKEVERRPAAGEVRRLPVFPTTAVVGLRPVASLTTRELGDEWVRTTAALATRLSPATRATLVLRREQTLDELERRDPEGFSLWLAAGPAGESDPADFVRGGPARPGPVADTDAA
jgi:hypothetical protein